MINIYCDGACSQGGDWSGGAAMLVEDGGHVVYAASIYEPKTTNNIMELRAFIMALEAVKELKKDDPIIVHTDSAYIYNAITQKWIDNWQRNGWLTSKKDPVANQDEWKAIIILLNELQNKIQIAKVQAHKDNVYNNVVDKLAVEARMNKKGVKGGVL